MRAEGVESLGRFLDERETGQRVRAAAANSAAAAANGLSAASQRSRTGPVAPGGDLGEQGVEGVGIERRNFHFPANEIPAGQPGEACRDPRLTNGPESSRRSGQGGRAPPDERNFFARLGVDETIALQAGRLDGAGARLALVRGSALIAAATPCAVQRSRKSSRRAMPASGESRSVQSGLGRAPAVGSEFAQGIVLSADPLQIKEEMPFARAQTFIARRERTARPVAEQSRGRRKRRRRDSAEGTAAPLPSRPAALLSSSRASASA